MWAPSFVFPESNRRSSVSIVASLVCKRIVGPPAASTCKTLSGVALASDGFFPFQDSIFSAKKHGVKCIVQPGNSIRDPEIIRACNTYGMTMLFTNNRLFTH